jgi:hypothetical protein
MCGFSAGTPFSSEGESELTFPSDDPQGRQAYRGEMTRGRVPHGTGEMVWRPGGNYRRFVGRFDNGEMADGTLWFGIDGQSTYS